MAVIVMASVPVTVAGIRLLTRHASEEGSLVHPQHVARGENHADRGEGRPIEVHLRRTLQYQIFADEVVQRGQSDTRQSGDQKDGCQPWSRSGNASVC